MGPFKKTVYGLSISLPLKRSGASGSLMVLGHTECGECKQDVLPFAISSPFDQNI